MLIAAVGPARVIRSLKVRASPYQTLIDDTIDEYLAAADIPPRPRGFDWYIRTPPRHDTERRGRRPKPWS
ncbi:DUF5956 family protein [Arthrobacter sp. NPDC057259]|uniref:DUF5956 family protein n=1 Tax=Arthrobacter sp. NPDC057259 TaxID=3346073 RepID=UPI0036333276